MFMTLPLLTHFSSSFFLFTCLFSNAVYSYRSILWIFKFGMLYSPPYLEAFMVLFAVLERFVKLHFSLYPIYGVSFQLFVLFQASHVPSNT